MLRTGLLLTFAAGCALAISFSPPAFSGDIIGSVVDANGNPLQGVQVIVKAQNSSMTGAAITNQTGQYEIEGLNSGPVLHHARSEGNQSHGPDRREQPE